MVTDGSLTRDRKFQPFLIPKLQVLFLQSMGHSITEISSTSERSRIENDEAILVKSRLFDILSEIRVFNSFSLVRRTAITRKNIPYQ